MLRGYRGIIAAAFGVTALIFGIVYGLNQQALYEQEAQHRSADYTARAANQITQSCLGVAASEKPKCLKEEATEYKLKIRDNSREQQDLAAQQTSALWTGIMGVAALIGMALSAIGVALVWTTFQETKQTNLIAMRENARNTRRTVATGRETAHALEVAARNADAASAQVRISEDTAKRELRAYIKLEPVITDRKFEYDEPIVIPFMMINYGKTPAKNCNFLNSTYLGPDDYIWPDNIPENTERTSISIHSGSQIVVNITTNNPVSKEHFGTIQHGNFIFLAREIVFYEDVFGEQHYTQIAIQLGKDELLSGKATLSPNGNTFT